MCKNRDRINKLTDRSNFVLSTRFCTTGQFDPQTEIYDIVHLTSNM
jgi:hypothetical protein